MLPIYIFPACVGLAVAALVILWARRRHHNLIVSTFAAVVLGAAAWFVTLYAVVTGLWTTMN